VVVRVVLTGVMTNPFVAARMNVGSFGVSFLVAIGPSLFLSRAGLLLRLTRLLLSRSGTRRWSRTGMRRWTMSRNVPAANTTHPATFAAAILRRRGNCKQQEREEYTEKVFHFNLLNVILEAI
jgi:hypothetical protein